MRAILEAMRATGACWDCRVLAGLAEAHGKAGQAEEGLALLAEARIGGEDRGTLCRSGGASPEGRAAARSIPLPTRQRRRRASARRSRSRAGRARSPGSFARRPASRASGSSRAEAKRHASFSPLSTTGSPKASTPGT